ncbi:probable 2-ketogluconate reductase isoform X2 [Apteryx mantelli]|uniref:Probable 2-ketogluconate reductase isoform X2 n=1 Tax=Apteryx mantelli TaxID=2696672 RepID=A0ABM4E2S6_9AVES|nr:PREDICTED: probable 2-ketogluconate reductase isoform X1 [Apteryx mantelli mantelli]XP_013796406.1 PREDICTED: probable 2-ketogluconate reductase isoform X2 [Apteryx mantelli mantelli]XP_013796412.1 PREDICTED: probable 2-ketogluconate reductase isoform X1 [Apteryx mantelli mantelli]
MFRGRAFGLLKSLHLMDGQPNLACKFIHPAITSHVHHCQKRNVDYTQSYKTGPSSAGGQTRNVPKIMAEQELPGVLILDIGGTHGVLENLVAFLKKHFRLITMKEFLENKKEMSKKIQSVFMFECRPTIDRELLESLPNLKVIANSGVGVDHLDLKMISNFGVKVTNTPHAVADSTADIGMALMLASARRLVEGCQISISRDTKYFAVDWLGVEVTRATLGIIGMGNIGYKVAQRAKAFEMKILYHNRNQRKKEEEQAVGAHYCEKIEDLLQQSDFVMLVVNLTPETCKLIGKRELGLMKPTATLINISRGAVIDQDALVEALQKKVIMAAALDVTYPEPLPRDHPLLKLDNIIITPHIGTATVQAIRMMAEEAITNMLAVLNGQPIPSEVFPR